MTDNWSGPRRSRWGGTDWISPTGYAVVMEQERHCKFNAGSIGLKPGDKKR